MFNTDITEKIIHAHGQSNFKAFERQSFTFPCLISAPFIMDKLWLEIKYTF